MTKKDFAIMDSFQVQCCFGTQNWSTMEVPAKGDSTYVYKYDCKRCNYCGRFYVRGRDLEQYKEAHGIPWDTINAAPRFERVSAGPQAFRDRLRNAREEVRTGIAEASVGSWYVSPGSVSAQGMLTAAEINRALERLRGERTRIRRIQPDRASGEAGRV